MRNGSSFLSLVHEIARSVGLTSWTPRPFVFTRFCGTTTRDTRHRISCCPMFCKYFLWLFCTLFSSLKALDQVLCTVQEGEATNYSFAICGSNFLKILSKCCGARHYILVILKVFSMGTLAVVVVKLKSATSASHFIMSVRLCAGGLNYNLHETINCNIFIVGAEKEGDG